MSAPERGGGPPRQGEPANTNRNESPPPRNSRSPSLPQGSELLEVVHAAWLAGYTQGLTEGRASERATIDWELAASRAALRSMRIALECPEIDSAEADRKRDRMRRRMGWIE